MSKKINITGKELLIVGQLDLINNLSKIERDSFVELRNISIDRLEYMKECLDGILEYAKNIKKGE